MIYIYIYIIYIAKQIVDLGPRVRLGRAAPRHGAGAAGAAAQPRRGLALGRRDAEGTEAPDRDGGKVFSHGFSH